MPESAGQRHALRVFVVDDHAFLEEGSVDAGGLVAVAAVEAAGLSDRWHVIDYLTTMEDALAVADLVVCRSGAGTVAEMEALGLPCIYVPLPIGNGEQRLNAKDHVEAGGAQLIDDKDFTADFVRSNVFPLLGSTRLAEMAAASQSLGRAGAARALADLALAQVKEDGHE